MIFNKFVGGSPIFNDTSSYEHISCDAMAIGGFTSYLIVFDHLGTGSDNESACVFKSLRFDSFAF